MIEKRRDAQAKKESILDAAVTAFVEQGFDRTSMDYVAKVANASKRTVYNHFPSKEILFQEIFDRFLEEVFAEKNIEYDSSRSIEDQLGDFADKKMSIAKDPKRLGIMRVAFGVFISHPELSERAFSKADAQEDGFKKWLKAAVKDGKLKIDNYDIAAETFWSMFSGTFFWPAIIQVNTNEAGAKALKVEYIKTFLSRYGA